MECSREKVLKTAKKVLCLEVILKLVPDFVLFLCIAIAELQQFLEQARTERSKRVLTSSIVSLQQELEVREYPECQLEYSCSRHDTGASNTGRFVLANCCHS